MAFKNLITIATLMAIFSIPSWAVGQLDVPGPKFRPRSVEEIQNTRPFAEPGVFDYDAQVFAPLEFSNDKQLGPRTGGFFLTFDRGYTNLSSNSTGSSSTNYGTGNRYNGGWISEEDSGWDILYEQVDANTYVNGQDILVSNPMYVNTKFANVEVNKVFIQGLKNGAWIQPYIGLRYFNVADSTIEDTPVVINGMTGGNRFKQNVTNNAVGGHVGGQYVVRRGRWRVSNDLALAATYNQQQYNTTDITNFATSQSIFEFGDSRSAFVPAVDYRFELAYSISRDFGIRGGLDFAYLWDGIVRANTAPTEINPNSAFGISNDPRGLIDSRLIAAGFTLGFEWRR